MKSDEVTEAPGLVPLRNPPALLGYYAGVFSLLPVVGFPLGVAGFFLGHLGLQSVRRNPAIKGEVHAWIGILLGGLMALLWGVVLILAFAG